MYRGAGDSEDNVQLDLVDHPPNKSLKDYKPVFQNSSVFFSTYNPDIVEQVICTHLKDNEIKYSLDESCYKIKFELTTKN